MSEDGEAVIVSKPSYVTILPEQPPLETGPLLRKLEESGKKFIVVQGGGDAAKTVTILQWLAIKAIQGSRLQITVVGVDIPNLKRGAMRVFKKYVAVDPQIAPFIRNFNISDREYQFATGSVISFQSFEDETNAIGAENDYVFMNEGNLHSYAVFWQLQRKCRRAFILDYNPTFAFWAHAKVINDASGKAGEAQFSGETQMYIVDHRHNPFLTDKEHENYENISDPERFMVYARGMTGKTRGAIFNFPKVISLPERRNEAGEIVPYEFGFGIDIGYTTDKTCIVKVYMSGKDHYYEVLLYKSNDEIQNLINENDLTGPDGLPMTIEGYMKDILVTNGATTATLIWGDHDKNMSTKLRRINIPYRMARKGPNSVAASISSVKRFNGFSLNSPILDQESITYIWDTAVDVLTGNEVTTGVPIEGVPDHAIAAIRYFDHSYAMRFST